MVSEMETTFNTRSTPQPRSLTPDVARGLMLALIAVENVGVYLHGREYGYQQKVIETNAIDRSVQAIVPVMVDGRAFPLFAVLFGFGIAYSFRRRIASKTSSSAAKSTLKRRCF